MGQNRDMTAALLALMDKPTLAAKKDIARRMVADGATTREIIAATREKLGAAIGAGTVGRIRREVEQEAKRKERKARRAARVPKVASAEAPPTLNGNAPDVLKALMAAGVPFSFDGRSLVIAATTLKVG